MLTIPFTEKLIYPKIHLHIRENNTIPGFETTLFPVIIHHTVVNLHKTDDFGVAGNADIAFE